MAQRRRLSIALHKKRVSEEEEAYGGSSVIVSNAFSFPIVAGKGCKDLDTFRRHICKGNVFRMNIGCGSWGH